MPGGDGSSKVASLGTGHSSSGGGGSDSSCAAACTGVCIGFLCCDQDLHWLGWALIYPKERSCKNYTDKNEFIFAAQKS